MLPIPNVVLLTMQVALAAGAAWFSLPFPGIAVPALDGYLPSLTVYLVEWLGLSAIFFFAIFASGLSVLPTPQAHRPTIAEVWPQIAHAAHWGLTWSAFGLAIWLVAARLEAGAVFARDLVALGSLLMAGGSAAAAIAVLRGEDVSHPDSARVRAF